jgi:hypothetical protein
MGGLQQQQFSEQLQQMQANWNQQQALAQLQLKQASDAYTQQAGIFGGLGQLAGGIGGFAGWGIPGAMAGSSLFGGGGGGLSKMFGGGGGGSGGGTGWSMPLSWGQPFGGLFSRQMGGPVTQQQPYMVGERGPELFVPHQSGMIIPNRASQGSSRGWGFGGV